MHIEPRRARVQIKLQGSGYGVYLYHHEDLGEEGHGSGGEHHGEGDRVEPCQRLRCRHEELVAPPPPQTLPLHHAHAEDIPRRSPLQRGEARGRPSPSQRRPQHRRRRRRIEKPKWDALCFYEWAKQPYSF
jgi:hypothetical protein